MMNLELKVGEFDKYVVRTKSIFGGIQYLFRFENNRGASVVKHSGSYGHTDDLWELAVVVFIDDKFDLDYSTEITNDVLGYLTDEEVEDTLKEIKDLPEVEEKIETCAEDTKEALDQIKELPTFSEIAEKLGISVSGSKGWVTENNDVISFGITDERSETESIDYIPVEVDRYRELLVCEEKCKIYEQKIKELRSISNDVCEKIEERIATLVETQAKLEREEKSNE